MVIDESADVSNSTGVNENVINASPRKEDINTACNAAPEKI